MSERSSSQDWLIDTMRTTGCEATLGKRDFTDPEIEDLCVAGFELSLLTDELIPRYYNGTRTQENSQISNQISRTFLPRGSKTFLQLRVELDSELDGLRTELNSWVDFILSY